MASVITCPSCGHQFDPGDSFRKEVQEQLRSQMEDWKKKKEKEFNDKETSYQQQIQSKEAELIKKLAEEKQKLQQELQESVRKTVSADYENQLRMLKETALDSEEKLKDARKKNLNFYNGKRLYKTKKQKWSFSCNDNC
jgi:hypothetical protein